MKFLFLLIMPFSFCFSQVINGIDLEKLELKLNKEGLEGWVHASAPDYRQYVFTYRDPKNFFRFVNLPMYPKKRELGQIFEGLGRHDKIFVQGMMKKNDRPIPHVAVNEIKVLKKYIDPAGSPTYSHKVVLPDDLESKTKIQAKVHAIFLGGAVVLIDYDDAVIPLITKNTSLTKDLFRSDIISIHYKLEQNKGVSHLVLDESKKEPLKLLSPMKVLHQKEIELSGELAMFPKSPQIIFNIFALRHKTKEGEYINYTLVNFKSSDLFKKILKKLQKSWDENSSSMQRARNHYINKKIIVKARGIKNIIDPNQANPQILISKLEDIQITVK